MQSVPSPRLAELSRKMQQGIRKNAQWFMGEMRKIKPGQNIPYDPKLNLTLAEYNELNHPIPLMQLRKRGSASIFVKAVGMKRLLTGEKTLHSLGTLEVDLLKRTVRTPYGVLNKMATVTANASQLAGEPWNGAMWKLDTMNHKDQPALATGTEVEFAVGKLQKSGRIQLSYKAQQFRVGKLPASLNIFFSTMPRCDEPAGIRNRRKGTLPASPAYS